MANIPPGICKLGAAESVCRPGSGPDVACGGCTTVTAVTVLRSPLAIVVVLWKVDVNGVVADDELLVVVVMDGVDDGEGVDEGVDDDGDDDDGVEDGEVDGEGVDDAEPDIDDEDTESEDETWSVDEPVDPGLEPVVEPVVLEPVVLEPMAPVEPAVEEAGTVDESESVVELSVADGVDELTGSDDESEEDGSAEEDESGGEDDDGSSEVNGSRILDLDDRLTSDDAGDAVNDEAVALETALSCRLRFSPAVSRTSSGFRRSTGWSEMATAEDARSDDTSREARRVIMPGEYAVAQTGRRQFSRVEVTVTVTETERKSGERRAKSESEAVILRPLKSLVNATSQSLLAACERQKRK